MAVAMPQVSSIQPDHQIQWTPLPCHMGKFVDSGADGHLANQQITPPRDALESGPHVIHMPPKSQQYLHQFTYAFTFCRACRLWGGPDYQPLFAILL